VREEDAPVVESDEDVFAAPPDRFDRRAAEVSRERARRAVGRETGAQKLR
jgi:hypothetical protein